MVTKTMSVKARFVVLVVALGVALAGSGAASEEAHALYKNYDANCELNGCRPG